MATSLEADEASGDLDQTIEVQSFVSPGVLRKERHKSFNAKWEPFLKFEICINY